MTDLREKVADYLCDVLPIWLQPDAGSLADAVLTIVRPAIEEPLLARLSEVERETDVWRDRCWVAESYEENRLSEVERETIERCAKVAESFDPPRFDSLPAFKMRLAATIRALAEKP